MQVLSNGEFLSWLWISFLCDSSKLYEYCSKYEDCEKIKSKTAELIKKVSEIFPESDEKREIFDCAKVVYPECSIDDSDISW